MAIRWYFDREKLTPREAQLVAALLDLTMLSGRAALAAGGAAAGFESPPRDLVERFAETVRVLIGRSMPDLEVRWEWWEAAPPQAPGGAP
jgi:hypothetical protein